MFRYIYSFLLLSVFVSTIATSNYNSAQQGSNLLIVAGVNGLDYYPESEVIDLENGGNCDSSWTKFPRDIIGGTNWLPFLDQKRWVSMEVDLDEGTTNLLICLFVCSFVCSFVRSFVRSFACSFVHSFGFFRLFICSFVRSFLRSFLQLFVHSFTLLGENVSSTLLICGGAIQNYETGETHSSKECYLLTKYSATIIWLMEERRAFAAGLNSNNKYFWITGGIDYDTGNILSSTEYVLKVG